MKAGADQLARGACYPKEAFPSFQLNRVKWHSAVMVWISPIVLSHMFSRTSKMLPTILPLKPFQHQFR